MWQPPITMKTAVTIAALAVATIVAIPQQTGAHRRSWFSMGAQRVCKLFAGTTRICRDANELWSNSSPANAWTPWAFALPLRSKSMPPPVACGHAVGRLPMIASCYWMVPSCCHLVPVKAPSAQLPPPSAMPSLTPLAFACVARRSPRSGSKRRSAEQGWLTNYAGEQVDHRMASFLLLHESQTSHSGGQGVWGRSGALRRGAALPAGLAPCDQRRLGSVTSRADL
jgi:hypothetical protein